MDPIVLLGLGFLGGMLAKGAYDERDAAPSPGLPQAPPRPQLTDTTSVAEQFFEAQGIGIEQDEVPAETARAAQVWPSFVKRALGSAAVESINEREQMGADPAAVSWREIMGKVPGLTEGMAMYFMLQDPEVPWHIKAQIAAALMYVVSPFDFLPEASLGPAGLADDAGIIYYAFKNAVSSMRSDHFRQAQDWLRAHGIEPKPYMHLGVPVELLEWFESTPGFDGGGLNLQALLQTVQPANGAAPGAPPQAPAFSG